MIAAGRIVVKVTVRFTLLPQCPSFFSDIPLKLPIDMQNRMSETAFTRSSKGSCLQDTLRLNRRITISYVSYDCSLQLTDIPFNMKYRPSILYIHPP